MIWSGQLAISIHNCRYRPRLIILGHYPHLIGCMRDITGIYYIWLVGTDPNTLFSEIYPHFIGCLRDIKYINKDGKLVAIPVSMMEGIVEGCVDQCTNSPCHHGGQCINMYIDAVCDCFGTDYQGPFCSDLGMY